MIISGNYFDDNSNLYKEFEQFQQYLTNIYSIQMKLEKFHILLKQYQSNYSIPLFQLSQLYRTLYDLCLNFYHTQRKQLNDSLIF